MRFVNRENELALLSDWWAADGARLGIVWGRRRVGKSALLGRFAADKPAILHTAASRPPADELRVLARAAAGVVRRGLRDLEARPFVDWTDALDFLGEQAVDEPLLLVLDEFPELVAVTPELPSILRAFWDRARAQTRLRILLSGSAVRTMEAMQEERAPLYGRADLALLLHPFEPHEAAAMLPSLSPSERALVWGLVGGVPLYLEWWDDAASVSDNLRRLVCTPGGALLNEGQLVLSTEGDQGQIAGQSLRSIALGRTRFGEIRDAVRTDPTRTLERLVALRLVERIVPVTEDPRRTRRAVYRIADNFLSFWLRLVEPLRGAIDHGMGASVLPVLESSLDDFMGPRWENAFRAHLRHRAAQNDLPKQQIVAIGPWWRDQPAVEIDAVALAGRRRRPVLVGEAKWARKVDGRRIAEALAVKARALPDLADDHARVVCARDEVEHREGLDVVTSRDIFG
jgi:AAA+ ATPase superfamily predicted ATPase